MTTYAPQQLEERYNKLPDALKEAMFSVDISQKLFEIGKKSGLTIEHIGFMADETGYMILGLTQPNTFAKNLSDALGVDVEKAKSIAAEINHQIFFPLREALKETHQIEITEETIQNGEPVIRESRIKNQELEKIQTPSPQPSNPEVKTPEPTKPPAEEKPKTVEEERKEAIWKMLTRKQELEKASKIPPIDLRKPPVPPGPEKPKTTPMPPPSAPRGRPAPPETPVLEHPPKINHGKPEIMLGGGIFVAPPEKSMPPPPTPIPQPPLKPSEKKTPPSGIDPYREPIE